MKKIPGPTIKRLCRLYNLLTEMNPDNNHSLSSKEIGKMLGIGAHNIRKDINYLGEAGITGSGYEVKKLKQIIENKLGLNIDRKACIIGLSSLGLAIISFQNFLGQNLKIIAGFDSNINKLETIQTGIPLYPTYEITEILKDKNIELAVIADHNFDPQIIIARLIAGGIKGIINFSSLNLGIEDKNIFIRNIDPIGEFRYLSALLYHDRTGI